MFGKRERPQQFLTKSDFELLHCAAGAQVVSQAAAYCPVASFFLDWQVIFVATGFTPGRIWVQVSNDQSLKGDLMREGERCKILLFKNVTQTADSLR